MGSGGDEIGRSSGSDLETWSAMSATPTMTNDGQRLLLVVIVCDQFHFNDQTTPACRSGRTGIRGDGRQGRRGWCAGGQYDDYGSKRPSSITRPSMLIVHTGTMSGAAAASCVTVNVRPAIVAVPVRGTKLVFG
jgi:hypothetical protein